MCNWTGGPGRVISGGITMPMFVEALALYASRPVVDRTNLMGDYEFELVWDAGFVQSSALPDAPPIDPNTPILFTALQEQLGLKLEPATGPVQVLVIDSMARPTAN